MNKTILFALTLVIVSFQFYSCSTEYEGAAPKNDVPVINFYDTSDITSNKKTKIQWYGNDMDGIKTTYHYVITTDTMITMAEAKSIFPDSLWSSTDSTFAMVALPYRAFNADTFYTETGEWPAGDTTETFMAVYSKFFVYATDEIGEESNVMAKIFKRTNRKPKFPMVKSNKLGVNGFSEPWNTVGPDSAYLVLREESGYWKAFDFEWMGEDPDGPEVDLEFRWELWDRVRLTAADGETKYDSLKTKVDYSKDSLDSQVEWSVNWLRKKFDWQIYDNDPDGQYAFKVWVRDDALEESEVNATINFEVYSPTLAKGVILIDDTDPSLYPPASVTVSGNPDAAKTRVFYESLLEDAGYRPEGDSSVDESKWYKIVRYNEADNSPGIRELVNYKLLIITSDDRSNANGYKFNSKTLFTLESYLSVGGKVFMLGNSILYSKDERPMWPVNSYRKPARQVFEAEEQDFVTEVEDVPATSTLLRVFFSKYFGIYSMTFPEQKTYFTVNPPRPDFLMADHYMCDNYDFIGIRKYSHIIEQELPEAIRIDSTKVNDAWYDRSGPGGSLFKHSLKDNGTVFTGVPIIETFKGENVYEYVSIYDIEPLDDDYSYEITENEGIEPDTLKHFLWNWNYQTDELHLDEFESPVPVLHRSGAVASRFIGEDYAFKTAFFGIPTYFLEEAEVKTMFREMIKWFNMEKPDGNKGGRK